ncbi:MAG TPA: aminoglycoside phosphotransferase family protein [Nocardioides sp.]|uniref:aminoglycoside phosphotransferase family protein n=1 Tax=Nocardioides sp. TaxID=35761 RepID=UPI002D80286B|nr:aminoglycoside phosphotransferase family protein [Nocardioides sp.]HET6651384.1 aminoglycoside phosphotransferase family protein [Nocardioides sp.]
MTATLRTSPGLARDPALPRRDDLLDEELVAARLQGLDREPRTVAGCVRVRARYRPGESLRTTYRLVDERGDSRLVSARMFTAAKAPAKFLLARDEAARQGAPDDSVLLDEPMNTVFWVFPQDRKLRGLDRLTDPPEELRAVFGRPWLRSELVAYTPEKAATVRCSDAGGVTVGFAKVHAGDDGRHSVDTLAAVRRSLPPAGGPTLPEPVGYLSDLRMSLLSPVPGQALHHLPRAEVPAAMAALGETLSMLHRGSVAALPPFTRLDPDRLTTAGVLLQTARPDLADLTGAVVSALLAAPRRPAPAALLHGDLHPKNVLVHDTGIGLVDLDQAAAGPAGAELGGTLARLWCPRPHDPIDPDTAAAAADALLAAYARPPSADDLRWFAAAALLVERAVRAVSRVDVATLAELERVLSTSLEWATEGAHPR